MAESHTANCRIALASQHDAWNSSCFVYYKWKNLNWTFDVFILRLSAAICTQELTKIMTSTAVLPFFIQVTKTKGNLHFTRLLSSYGNNFISIGINFNLDRISWAVTPCLWAVFFRRFEESCYRNLLWKFGGSRIISRAPTDVDGDEFWFCPGMSVRFERTKAKWAGADTKLFIVWGRLCGCFILCLILNNA